MSEIKPIPTVHDNFGSLLNNMDPDQAAPLGFIVFAFMVKRSLKRFWEYAAGFMQPVAARRRRNKVHFHCLFEGKVKAAKSVTFDIFRKILFSF